MSAFGPKLTSIVAPHMSAFGGKADIYPRDRRFIMCFLTMGRAMGYNARNDEIRDNVTREGGTA
jgi:hypothetical protein